MTWANLVFGFLIVHMRSVFFTYKDEMMTGRFWIAMRKWENHLTPFFSSILFLSKLYHLLLLLSLLSLTHIQCPCLQLSFSLWVVTRWWWRGDLWCMAVGSEWDVLFSGVRKSLPFHSRFKTHNTSTCTCMHTIWEEDLKTISDIQEWH